jgi:hypothetical protein
MYLTKEVKEEIFAKHGGSATNTGSLKDKSLCLPTELTT